MMYAGSILVLYKKFVLEAALVSFVYLDISLHLQYHLIHQLEDG